MRAFFIIGASLVAALALPTTAPAAQPEAGRASPRTRSPAAAVEELLAADRAFSAASEKADLVTGLAAMLDEAVVMPAQGFKFALGKAEAIAVLRANPANATARAKWAPVRGGISRDGSQGFTFGYMIVEEPGKPSRPAKYLSYWVKRPEGWRVAAYKRAPLPDGEVPLAIMPPALPDRLVPPHANAAALAAHAKSLDAAERAFSDEAQVIGLGAAFAKHGSADAMNMGPGAGFTIGADAIGQAIGAGPALSLRWAPDDLLVASSGDLGVTWGMIRPNGPAAEGQPSAIPFFTVWRRTSADAPWLYIAE